ncbi:MAG: DUF4123 domain-containing protein [Pseudomonas sp.]|uniref:DUF4123 domain-containing protein n=1 Tax=Pseudomonas putida (strain ATCC 700007 / DSM 6899 / JCM 31910 / BCRC 17059 / LMG 24140 / F1) TaxID=351746 RepID=A5W2Z9_PSEP1|nr:MULTISPECIES: DUF4123 domain-containing protein [Pseudomonas]MPT07912.1 DUF4123 domain-containing protein [Pseudomonas sp.]ANC81118.1 hypothetical protein KKK_08850 [Pseudomonas putida B6-2]MDD2001635.1 DUF4123 domain-containing protein [Pseudomonas putida]MEB3440649.1 DUF4123 domain-containing protein [Pseudomonas sp. A2]POA80967.1 DUF4123 domain-containing protein [Pseudomonas sp. FW305-E2]
MPSPFVRAMVDVLRASDHYRLSAIVEMANLTPKVQEQLTGHYTGRCWPLLQQAQFSNLRTAGPWLFGSRLGSDVSAQYDFQWQLEQGAAGAVCGWIVSALPAARLAGHLSHANIVTGTDGHSYLLRFHTAAALLVLDRHRELPGVSEWLAPIHHWWAPVAHPSKRLWMQISGGNQPQSTHCPPITLNEACWAELAGDPLSYQLAELLKNERSCPTLHAACHGTRVGLIQHYLDQARAQGLGREEDLISYVLMLARGGEQLSSSPAWQEAIAATREQQTSLMDNVQRCLRTKD